MQLVASIHPSSNHPSVVRPGAGVGSMQSHYSRRKGCHSPTLQSLCLLYYYSSDYNLCRLLRQGPQLLLEVVIKVTADVPPAAVAARGGQRPGARESHLDADAPHEGVEGEGLVGVARGKELPVEASREAALREDRVLDGKNTG